MSLFSNTVMITIHPVRKYASFTGYKTISCFYLVGFCLSFLQECHAGCKWFCWKPLFHTKQHTYRQDLIWFTKGKMQIFDSADRPYEFIFKIKHPERPVPTLRLFCKLISVTAIWKWNHVFGEAMTEAVLNLFNALRGMNNKMLVLQCFSDISKHIILPTMPAGLH